MKTSFIFTGGSLGGWDRDGEITESARPARLKLDFIKNLQIVTWGSLGGGKRMVRSTPPLGLHGG